jgi:putative ABC transport system ATP-binding protein
MSEQPLLRAEGLTRVFGTGDTAVHALTGASLELAAGELVVLRGPSGSGKTTLLNLLGGLDAPSSGSVWLGERNVTKADEAELVDIRRREIGYVFQSFALLPMLSATENVELPLRLLETKTAARGERVRELLAQVGLSAHANQRPYELSGGQQQRVAIARALANRPRLLIADEPTGQLDSATAEAMMLLIAALVHEQGVAAIVSTHDPKMADAADRVIEIKDGSLHDGASPARA